MFLIIVEKHGQLIQIVEIKIYKCAKSYYSSRICDVKTMGLSDGPMSPEIVKDNCSVYLA